MIMQGMSQIREAYFISFRGEINQKNMEERENEMKQKKTGISAEKQEQWICLLYTSDAATIATV